MSFSENMISMGDKGLAVMLYPLDRYVEELVSPYHHFVERYLGVDLEKEVEGFFRRRLEALRKGFEIAWVLPRGVEGGKLRFFDVREHDRMVYDELSLEELLFSEKYSSFTAVVETVREFLRWVRVGRLVVGGFHLNDCLKKLVDKISREFGGRDVRVSVEYGLTDYGVRTLVYKLVERAYSAFQGRGRRKVTTVRC